jgi:hypothetical protein
MLSEFTSFLNYHMVIVGLLGGQAFLCQVALKALRVFLGNENLLTGVACFFF